MVLFLRKSSECSDIEGKVGDQGVREQGLSMSLNTWKDNGVSIPPPSSHLWFISLIPSKPGG